MASLGAVTPFANAEPTTTVIVTTDAAAHIIRIAIGSLDMARFHPSDLPIMAKTPSIIVGYPFTREPTSRELDVSSVGRFPHITYVGSGNPVLQ